MNTGQSTSGTSSEDQNTNSGNQTHVDSVRSVKMPLAPVSRKHEHYVIWFIQMERWFDIAQIRSDSTKFSAVITALSQDLAVEVFDVITNPPDIDKYLAVKSAILRIFTESEQKRIQQFITGIQLGDRKPSQLLNELRRVGGEGVTGTILQNLWLQRLPVPVQTSLAVLTARAQVPIDELAVAADAVNESFALANTNAVTQVKPTALETQINEICKRFDALEKRFLRDSPRSRSASRTRGRARSSQRPTATASTSASDAPGECWYHRKFGDDATRCRPPCTRGPKN